MRKVQKFTVTVRQKENDSEAVEIKVSFNPPIEKKLSAVASRAAAHLVSFMMKGVACAQPPDWDSGEGDDGD